MAKRLPLVLTLVLFAASTVILAEVQTVRLKSGRELTGEVTKTATGYTVKTKAGVLNVKAADVEFVGPATDPEAEYKARLAKINPRSVDDHVELAKWAYSKNLLDIAQKECKDALAINKDDLRAQLMLRQVNAAIEDAAKGEAAMSQPASGAAATGSGAVGETLDKILISNEDINRIRLQELRKDENVGVEFKNEVLEKYIKDRKLSGEDEQRLRSLSRVQQAIEIRDDADRAGDAAKYCDDIVVTRDPRFMNDFKMKVWPTIRNQCSSVQCHGGEKAPGGLKLFTTPENERMSYTNYVILDGFKSNKGRMIDRDDPESSLMLQYMLPASETKAHHSKEIRPVVQNTQGRQYKDALEWISKELQPTPHPNYRLKWTPPFGMKLDFGQAVIDLNKLGRPSSPASAPAGK